MKLSIFFALTTGQTSVSRATLQKQISRSINLFIRIAIVVIAMTWPLIPLQASDDATKEQSMAVFLIQGSSQEGTSSGTGFACRFKEREFVATNLHVLEGASSISVMPQSGNIVKLSGKVIVAEDADICLLGITGEFSDIGVTPLEFVDDVFKESKTGDRIFCLGNSLGNGVITATNGTIKAYGQPRLEIDSPVVRGNSGGPIVHEKTGKVVGLVTEAIINKSKFDELGIAASKSIDSPVQDISYFGHRVDTVRKWTATTMKEYMSTSQVIAVADKGLVCATLFLVDRDGWQEDRRLADAWRDYSKFIDQAKEKTTKRVEVTKYVNDFGVVVRTDAKVKGNGVSQHDYEKAYQTFRRSVEWKIIADQETLKRVKPLGYRQIDTCKLLMNFSTQVLTLQKEL